jgi:SAM-dependent methyltransferase
MRVLIYSVKLKNFIKANCKEDNKLYRFTQGLYRRFIFPYERAAWKKKTANGFESETALHMCSLLPKKTLDAVINYYHPKTWLDVGCGTGTSLKYVQKQGIKTMGLENSDLAIKISKLQNLIRKHDLTVSLDLQQQFDVIWCYEVAEHLPEGSADTFLNTLVCHSKYIVLSAAVPGQGGDGHINEQPASYWIKKMNERGYIVDSPLTESIHALHELYSGNIQCFKKAQDTQ